VMLDLNTGPMSYIKQRDIVFELSEADAAGPREEFAQRHCMNSMTVFSQVAEAETCMAERTDCRRFGGQYRHGR